MFSIRRTSFRVEWKNKRVAVSKEAVMNKGIKNLKSFIAVR